MPGGDLGTIRGRISLDVTSAIAGYAAVRRANASTINTMNDASNRMKGFGVAAVAMGGAFLVGFGKAVNAAADFEKKLDYFGAVNNATAGEMEKVRAKALELGRTSQYSAGQIADAFVEMGKAGVSAKDITDGMAQAMVNLASAADIDLAQATNIVTSQIQAYGLTAKDAVHVTDLMAGAANASIVDVEDLGVSLKYVGGVAHSLGISFDSTIDALSLLGKAGIKGSTAGTSLRQIMVSLAGGTDKAKGQLEELGIITKDGTNLFFNAQGQAKSLAEVFQILQTHTAGLTQKERLMAFRTIFNNRALAAAQILTKEGAKGFAEMNGEISKTTAADVAAKRMDNLAGDIKKLKGNIDTLLIEGGTPFQGFLRGIVQGITKLVQLFGSLPAPIMTAILSFMLVAGVVLTIAGTIAIFGAAITGAIGSIKSVVGAFQALWKITKAVTVATRAMTLTALANPYVLIALAVIALVAGMVLLYKKSETFRNIINAIGRGLKTGFLAAVEWFKTLPGVFSKVWDSISSAFTTGINWIKKNWDILLTIFTGPVGLVVLVIRRFGDDIVNFLTSIPGRVTGFVSSAWGSFMSFLNNLPAKVGYALGFVLGTLTKWGFQAVTWSVQFATNIGTAIYRFFIELPGKVWGWLTQTYDRLVQWGAQMTVKGTQAATNTYNGITNWFQKLPGRIWGFLTSLVNGSITRVNSLKTALVNGASSAYNGTVNWFQKLPGRIWDFMVSTKNRVASGATSIINTARDLGSKAYHGVVDTVANMPGRVWDILQNVKQQFLNMVSSAFNSAKQFAGGLWDGFKDGLGIHSPSYIERAMFAISDTTGRESVKLKSQVRSMQSLSRGLQEVQNNASMTMSSLPDWVSTVRNRLQSSGLQYDAALAVEPARRSLASGDSTTSAKGLETAQDQRAISVTVYNPIAERASDSAAKKLRTLSSLGAF
ncbi:phage tail tape measure protein [Streptomyces sp. NPDC002248]